MEGRGKGEAIDHQPALESRDSTMPSCSHTLARVSLSSAVFSQNGEEEEDEEEEGMGPGRSGCKDEDGPIRGRGHRRDGRRESRYADTRQTKNWGPLRGTGRESIDYTIGAVGLY